MVLTGIKIKVLENYVLDQYLNLVSLKLSAKAPNYC